MIEGLFFNRFKNLRTTFLHCGKFSLIIGANATGKSNVREAFRFLHGISRGYELAEIFGEKYIGGDAVWQGIRGGLNETFFRDKEKAESFFTLSLLLRDNEGHYYDYTITISAILPYLGPLIFAEHLAKSKEWPSVKANDTVESNSTILYSTESTEAEQFLKASHNIPVQLCTSGSDRSKTETLSFARHRPILTQLPLHSHVPEHIRKAAQTVISALQSMHFLDLHPEAMRTPSIPGQRVLSDRGENLSSVLLGICDDPKRKQAVIEWIRELTPMDVVDFEFPADQTGRVLVSLVEANGQRISAYSASDGTLRFLGIVAALLSPEPARFYFIEEIENGIHPSRLHLLLQLIEQTVENTGIQVIATTHSPHVLGLASKKTIENSSLIYRLPNSAEARIKSLLEIPEINRVLETQDITRLHASGWLEDAVAFAAESETENDIEQPTS